LNALYSNQLSIGNTVYESVEESLAE
jgi:hypothetical protein